KINVCFRDNDIFFLCAFQESVNFKPQCIFHGLQLYGARQLVAGNIFHMNNRGLAGKIQLSLFYVIRNAGAIGISRPRNAQSKSQNTGAQYQSFHRFHYKISLMINLLYLISRRHNAAVTKISRRRAEEGSKGAANLNFTSRFSYLPAPASAFHSAPVWPRFPRGFWLSRERHRDRAGKNQHRQEARTVKRSRPRPARFFAAAAPAPF